MTLIKLIKQNDENRYHQGIFANNLTRKDIYKFARDAQFFRNDAELFPKMLRQFLIQTLNWGNFDRVVGRFKRNINSEGLITGINDFNSYSNAFIKTIENDGIEEIFNKFNMPSDLKIDNIGFAYFTKFLHFYSYGADTPSKMLIMDKWAILAFCALMIETSHKNIELTTKLTSKVQNGFTVKYENINSKIYVYYNELIFKLSNDLSISPARFEELMFGWGIRENRYGFQNPRITIIAKLNDYFKSIN